MKSAVVSGIGALALGLAWGCSSPAPNPLARDVHAEYDALSRDAQVGQYAPLALDDARKSVNQLDVAAKEGATPAELDHLAYLARTEMDIARVDADQGALEAKAGQLAQQRDQLMLEAKSSQAQKAQGESERLRGEMAMRDAEDQARTQALSQPQAAPAPAPPPPPAQPLAEQQRARTEAQQLESEGGQLQARETAEGIVLTLGDVLFATGSADLQPGATDMVARVAEYLNEFPDRPIEVAGHTDSVGTASTNQELSERRAQTVAVLLESKGVAPDRIQTKGYGEWKPIAPNTNLAGRQQNRRVEIVLVNPSAPRPNPRRGS